MLFKGAHGAGCQVDVSVWHVGHSLERGQLAQKACPCGQPRTALSMTPMQRLQTKFSSTGWVTKVASGQPMREREEGERWTE